MPMTMLIGDTCWDVFERMGFGIKWIKFCITLVTFSLLINGAPTGIFGAQSGLKQGDPLSPFLFLLAIWGGGDLENMLKTTNRDGWLKGLI